MSDEQTLLLLLNQLQASSAMVLADWYPGKQYTYNKLYRFHTLVHDTCTLIRKMHKYPVYVYKSNSSAK